MHAVECNGREELGWRRNRSRRKIEVGTSSIYVSYIPDLYVSMQLAIAIYMCNTRTSWETKIMEGGGGLVSPYQPVNN